MAISYNYRRQRVGPDRLMIPGLTMMGIAAVVSFFLLLYYTGFDQRYPYLYLLPWLAGLAVVLVIPSAILYYQDKFAFSNPIVLATWSYFFPAFVIGGLMLVFGWSQPYFLSFIQDSTYNLPFTVILIALGFIGLSLGFFLPLGTRIGALIARCLPQREHETNALAIPGLVLLFLGIFNSVAALILGIIGFQKTVSFETYDGLIFLTTLFWMQGTFVLWFIIFRQTSIGLQTVLIGALLLVASLTKALVAGNRGGLLSVFMTAGLAFLLAGRRLSIKQSIAAGTVLFLCLIGGMIYGTTFRNVKGTESAVSIDQYTENIFDTFGQVGRADVWSTLEFGLLSFAERVDTLSSVAVVVSNYEQLAPYEESYGLDNNIWKDVSTFFIPRVIWPDKPVASEARKYSDLYFNYPDNSFAITPIGDLLRNYGVVGVPAGMLLFGLLLRIIYRSLIEDQPRSIMRSTLYFMLLMAVSYEGFYGLLLPYLVKVGVTTVVGLVTVYLIATLQGYHSKPLTSA